MLQITTYKHWNTAAQYVWLAKVWTRTTHSGCKCKVSSITIHCTLNIKSRRVSIFIRKDLRYKGLDIGRRRPARVIQFIPSSIKQKRRVISKRQHILCSLWEKWHTSISFIAQNCRNCALCVAKRAKRIVEIDYFVKNSQG